MSDARLALLPTIVSFGALTGFSRDSMRHPIAPHGGICHGRAGHVQHEPQCQVVGTCWRAAGGAPVLLGRLPRRPGG